MAGRAAQCCLRALLARRGPGSHAQLLLPAFRGHKEPALYLGRPATWHQRAGGRYGVRPFSSATSGSDEEGEGEGAGSQESDGEGEEHLSELEEEGGIGLEVLAPIAHSHLRAVAAVTVPEVFPEVPVIPISRNPIFPRFVKMLEVSGPSPNPQLSLSHSGSRSVTRHS